MEASLVDVIVVIYWMMMGLLVMVSTTLYTTLNLEPRSAAVQGCTLCYSSSKVPNTIPINYPEQPKEA